MFEKLFAQSGLSLDRLRSFLEIVAAGGISAAARGDSNRQSQYSRQLKELEQFFGCQLLHRGRGPIKLTEAGRQLHQMVTHTFGAFDELRTICAQEPLVLRLGAGESLIHWFLLPRLGELTSGPSPLTLTLENLRTQEILSGLREGSLDFGIVTRLDADPTLAKSALGHLEYRLAVPSEMASSERTLRSALAVLDKLPLAMLEGSPTTWQALEREARKRKQTLNVRLRLSSYPQLVQAVRCLGLAAILPTLAAEWLDPDQVKLYRLPVLDALSREIALVWSAKAADLRPSIPRYAKCLTRLLRGPPAVSGTGRPERPFV
jgi:DNA-binding transcriptional LysR family regulator